MLLSLTTNSFDGSRSMLEMSKAMWSIASNLLHICKPEIGAMSLLLYPAMVNQGLSLNSLPFSSSVRPT
ncbi:hypothetical protein RRG08_026106 [Elysia crispata]|uniref:Uncharacterized protein n=1 Tax=Elysia crispata TaxID=231223 RepID=A0AAE1D399_9GAST|nr:hypothetical protein RRG08_026106 [Elysia crispata]